ncbi:BEM_collapsed_G0016550.mRNA.1.CDS.1 [Saccharomyces cerevisiae]|nr:BEM_collapsed_G0016550.mRNA.1.CDS.1 [Saccharomyces cerevisiae]
MPENTKIVVTNRIKLKKRKQKQRERNAKDETLSVVKILVYSAQRGSWKIALRDVGPRKTRSAWDRAQRRL